MKSFLPPDSLLNQKALDAKRYNFVFMLACEERGGNDLFKNVGLFYSHRQKWENSPPNWRLYSRLNCDGLSWPTWIAALVASCCSVSISRLASRRRALPAGRPGKRSRGYAHSGKASLQAKRKAPCYGGFGASCQTQETSVCEALIPDLQYHQSAA